MSEFEFRRSPPKLTVHLTAMTTASGLSLDLFKLATTFSANGVVHTRPGCHDEVWTDISVLGHGSQGTVYLQQLETGPTPLLRAVRELSQDLRGSRARRVTRELDMMMALRDVRRAFRRCWSAGC